MNADRRPTLAVWLLGLALCAIVVARTGLSTDMAAFLPRAPSAAQQVLVDQVRSGVASRLLLLGIEGAPPETLVMLSRDVGERLRPLDAFLSVNNGADEGLAGERDFFWDHRYLLSPAVDAERFTVAGLHAALVNDLRLLRTPLGALVKRTLPADPTGESLALLDAVAGGERPRARDGIWLSPDESRAILVVETRAAGLDLDTQARGLAAIGEAFVATRRAVPGADAARLLQSGPPVFAVRTRATMERDAMRFSLLATAIVAGLLLFAYRSLRVLLLGLIPVLSGALAGFAAVALGFGFVHGITLGFGVTLIGEAVDYSVYLFTQTAPGSSPTETLRRIWATLRLGMLTSVAGFAVMLFSSFAGFAQLGLFSITGLIVALAVVRWVLVRLLPADFVAPAAPLFAAPLLMLMRASRWLRGGLALLVLGALLALAFHRGSFWQEDIASLSPVPAADQQLDRALRAAIGAPDVRYLVVLSEKDEQAALTTSEGVADLLQPLIVEGALRGFDAPHRYLPSEAIQRARQAALPDGAGLTARLRDALAGLPFRADTFDPFLRDAAAAKTAPLLTRAALPPTLALKLDALLFARDGASIAALPLQSVSDPKRVAAAVAALARPDVSFVDLKQESDRLLSAYEREAGLLAILGSVAVLLLLTVSLRSPSPVLAVALPLAASVLVTAALITSGGAKLSIFDVLGLSLTVAIGSNYSLFFERQSREPEHRERSIASLGLANLCTVCGFGILSLSGIPVLHDIGATVAVGTFLSLIFSAILNPAGGARSTVSR
ncbi:MAG TPA: MMPL family transporter [Stellaceae bacterium]|nr:MMPL family transporter [Stellaceae bacterium]